MNAINKKETISLNEEIDKLEELMLSNYEFPDCPVTHRFTKGLYVREVFMPKGSLITSKIHKTQHQFFVLKGKCIVWIDGVEHKIVAPHIGITEPNTRRVLYIEEDCIWATAHPNEKDENAEEIEERIIEKHDNKYLTKKLKDKMSNH